MCSCNMDCLHCCNKDCTNDKMTDTERKLQDRYDMEVVREHIPEERKALRKGVLKQYDYNHSDKGRASRKRYEQSEKGRETAKRKSQKKIASGKNAEACRRYYARKKARKSKMS